MRRNQNIFGPTVQMNGPMQAQQPPVDPNALPPIDNWMSGLEAQQPAMPQQQAPQTPQNYLPQQYMDRISGLDNQRDAMMANTAGVFKKHPILSALGGFAAMGPVGLALPLLGGINQRERQMEVQKWYGDQRTALNNEFKDVILPSINYGTSAETANWYTQNAANMGRVGMSDGMGGIGAGMAGSDQGQGLAGGVSAQGQMQPMQFAGQLPTMMSPETAGHLMAQFGNLYSKSQEQGRQAGEFNAEAPKRQADVDKLRAEASKAAAEGRAQDALGLLRQAQVVSEKALAEERRASADAWRRGPGRGNYAPNPPAPNDTMLRMQYMGAKARGDEVTASRILEALSAGRSQVGGFGFGVPTVSPGKGTGASF
jgi:hypothetical protein